MFRTINVNKNEKKNDSSKLWVCGKENGWKAVKIVGFWNKNIWISIIPDSWEGD